MSCVKLELKPNESNPTYEEIEFFNVGRITIDQYSTDIYTDELGRTNFRHDKISRIEILKE